MRKIKSSFLFAFGVLLSTNLLSTDAQALQDSIPISTDFRIREVPYNPNDVFKFTGHYGFQSSIEFEVDEDIKTISVGDSLAWQIVPSGNRIFLKPIEPNPDTNMTVVTNKRVYYFQLHGTVTDDMMSSDMIFAMRFLYPGKSDLQVYETSNNIPEDDVLNNPQNYNFNYTIAGPDRISPLKIFDDGEFTYFQFRDINADVPAFFLVDSQRKEALINFRTVGDYIVIERVSSMFTLRHGDDVVCVFNEARPLQLHPDLVEDDD
ncbi:MAG: P-type conjugative transfer protein VirB9 [Alphaproteobacteria bacterium CG11_big_fil_rev_8_21_14_0_20_44_7]|nr:MAG: P-type conjugative transfer protein VirB9 [Alphaproteobacteria bacterium CG11_big_fil_rev_8_21_14_0_20_44_7]